jgi:hypothetical protein
VDRLREVPDGDWLRLDGPMGSHGRDQVRRALSALAAEGLIDLEGGRARLGSRAPASSARPGVAA